MLAVRQCTFVELKVLVTIIYIYIYIYIELFTSTCHETPEGKDCDCFQYIGAPTEQRGKISSKPHTSYFIQFLGRGKNEKNRLPLRLLKSHQKEH